MILLIMVIHNLTGIAGLATNSVDCILAAQSFHWFYNNPKAIEEIHRVLKPKAMLGLIWYVPDRSVSWIKNIEEILDRKFNASKVINTFSEEVLTPLQDHAGFVNEGSDLNTYTYEQHFDAADIINRYKSKSVIAAAQEAERQLMLQEIEQEIKTNPEIKNKEKFIFKFAMKIFWFQKA